MYPFSALQLTLLHWQMGEHAEEGLSDSDTEDDEGTEVDSSTQPSVRFSTQEAYDTYVESTNSPTLPFQTPPPGYRSHSRVGKIDEHYAWLGVELLFKHLPALECWLSESYDDKFVTKVRHIHHTLGIGSKPSATPTTDGKWCHRSAGRSHQ